MSKTKIKSALAALDKAAEAAFKVLNDATDGAFEGSPAEADPTRHVNEISQRLRNHLDHLEANAKYEGMSEEEIADLKAQEYSVQLEALQAASVEKLARLNAERMPVSVIDEDTDFEDPADGTEEPES